jgi:hypothetical protein
MSTTFHTSLGFVSPAEQTKKYETSHYIPLLVRERFDFQEFVSSTTRGAQVGIEFVIGRRNGNQDLDEEG